MFTALGLTVTEMGGGGGGVLLPPPHATRNPVSATAMHRVTILQRRGKLRPASPISKKPASGRLSGSHSRCFLPSDLCGDVPATPVNGPAVWTVIVTLVAPDPALICVGLNEQVVPVGPEHPNTTLLVNVLPTGETNIVVDAVCPGLAAGGFVRDAGIVKS